MIDHHVDRPGVEAQRCAKLTGPNRPTGSRSSHHPQHASVHRSTPQTLRGPSIARKHAKAGHPTPHKTSRSCTAAHHAPEPLTPIPGAVGRDACGWVGRPGGHGGVPAPDPIPNSAVKSPSAHGTCAPRHGRVGRRQVLQPIPKTTQPTITHAGWSSPVARQAHNLKAAGSNPAPATKLPRSAKPSALVSSGSSGVGDPVTVSTAPPK